MKSVYCYGTPVGSVGIAEDNGAIIRLFFGGEKVPSGFETAETPLIAQAAAQLFEYFGGKRKAFSVPIALRGTDFQMAVWNALMTIPFGETRSYEDVAVMVGNPRACRAVGMANNRNPIAIIVPCHRVTGKDGGLTGYAGGLPVKEYLLQLEKRHV